MNKYKISYTLSRVLRVEDKKDGVKNFEAESMEQAINKFYIFMKGFFGSRVSFKKIQVEQITK